MSPFRLFAVASVVMGASHTIARERIFESVRRRLGEKSKWLGYFSSCPYCVSQWVALAVVPLTGSYYIEVAPLWPPLAWALKWLFSSVFVATIAAYLRVLFYLADESQGLLRRAEKREDLAMRAREDGQSSHTV
jgi:hypothetical protein